MKKLIALLACVLASVANCQTEAPHAHHSPQAQSSTVDAEYDGTPGVVTGYVRDVACLLRNPKAGAANTPETKACMRKCVAGGSPIGILTSDGILYTPISKTIPDVSVRKSMLPYVGTYVRADGKLFERRQLHAIAISHIEVVQAQTAR
jgi:hypothetical protein